jgi:hypothetical protein
MSIPSKYLGRVNLRLIRALKVLSSFSYSYTIVIRSITCLNLSIVTFISLITLLFLLMFPLSI